MAAIISGQFSGRTADKSYRKKISGYGNGLSFPDGRDCYQTAGVEGETSAGMVSGFGGEITNGKKK
jgi:hypothetical protein